MNIIAQTCRALYSGKVICRYSMPNVFQFLSDAENMARIEAIIAPFALRIAMTSTQKAYFVTDLAGSAEAKAALAAQALAAQGQDWLTKFERFEAFANLIADIHPGSFRLEPGQVISAGAIAGAASDRPSLSEQIADISSRFGLSRKTDSERISRILDKLEDDGVLVCSDSNREQYIVTGLSDRYWDIAEHFVTYTPGLAAKVEEFSTVQKELF